MAWSDAARAAAAAARRLRSKRQANYVKKNKGFFAGKTEWNHRTGKWDKPGAGQKQVRTLVMKQQGISPMQVNRVRGGLFHLYRSK